MDVVLCAIVLMIGSSIRGTLLVLVGIPVTIGGFVFLVRALLKRPLSRVSAGTSHVEIWLSVMAAVGLLGPAMPGPLWFDAVRRIYFILALVVVGIAANAPGIRRRRAVTAMIVAGILIHAVTPFAVPNPQVDVWALTQAASRALLHGVQPYTIRTPDVYHGAYNFGNTAPTYPYMPATLIVFAPVVAVLGDYRILLALCVPVTIALIRAIGRARSADAYTIDLVTLAFLLHPRGLWLTEMGWTESLMVVVAAFSVLCAVRCQRARAAVAWMCLPALKQYVVVPPVLYLLMMSPRPRARTVLIALGAAAATAAPFVFWDGAATLHSILFQFQGVTVPRLDSTSIVAAAGLVTNHYPSRWWSVLAQLIVGCVGYARHRRGGLGAMLLVSAAALYGTFLVGWQAFVNYYYFVAVLLLLAAVASTAPGRDVCPEEFPVHS